MESKNRKIYLRYCARLTVALYKELLCKQQVMWLMSISLVLESDSGGYRREKQFNARARARL
jgi:hypothetical protein